MSNNKVLAPVAVAGVVSRVWRAGSQEFEAAERRHALIAEDRTRERRFSDFVEGKLKT